MVKISHREDISADIQFGWSAGSGRLGNLKPLVQKVLDISSKLDQPIICGGLPTPFIELQKAVNRKKINWTEAFKYYCTSVNGRYPSYSDVASKYKVNKNTVWKVAQKEEWIKHRQKVDEKRSGVLVLGKNLRK